MRPDGTRVKDLPPLVAAIPYIMPKRYDAWNSITENIDEEVIKDFIRNQSGLSSQIFFFQSVGVVDVIRLQCNQNNQAECEQNDGDVSLAIHTSKIQSIFFQKCH